MSLSLPVQAKTVKVNKDRLIKVIGVVGGEAINQAAELEKMTRKNRKPVWLLVNSPGGAVLPGMIFVEAIKQAKSRGVKIKCVTGVLAASMAFIYLSHCDERYALSQTRLLFHPISISTQARVQELIVDLDATLTEERNVMAHLQRSLGIDWKSFHRPYFAEVFWTAEGLNEYTKKEWTIIVDDIQGVGDSLYQWRKPRRGLFGQQHKIDTHIKEIVERFLGR